MNTKNRSSSNPYRRSNNKKRPKSNNRGRGGGNANYRSLPGNLGDLMSVMPSATKAVAHLISGNSRPSGQVVHARSVLGRAQKAIDDGMCERMPPAAKEDFLEQVALLRLTLADAASLEDDTFEEEAAEQQAGNGGEISMDRLRALALSIAGSTQTPAATPGPQEPEDGEDDDEEDDSLEPLAAATAALKSSSKSAPGKSSSAGRGLNNASDKLRLKAMLDERRNNSGS